MSTSPMVAGIVLLVAAGLPAIAWQAPAAEPVRLGSVAVNGSWRNRVESWRWFAPSAGDSEYTFNGATLRLGFSQNRRAFDWTIELEAPVLLGLPRAAVAPGQQGQLGMGATYFVANKGRRNAAMLFPKQASIRLHNIFGSELSTLKLGRFEFQDGGELAASDPTLAVVKRDRLQQRLIGPFVFTHVMRSFDGVHFSHTSPRKLNYTLLAATPTRGVFQVDGWGWLKTAFAFASATRQVETKAHSAEARVFSIYYRDWRAVTKADNRPAAVRAADRADIGILTYGANYLHLAKTSLGPVDLMAEGAFQSGKWGRDTHRAWMLDLEAGFQPKFLLPRWKPWLRAGYYHGSGDGDPADGRHQTFFQILPTARPYARFPFFNMENNVDRFAMLTLRPHPRFTLKSEAHSLRLAAGRDLWYIGGGAFQPWTFGYQSRSAGGARSLANLYDVNADIVISRRLTITPYVGYAAGRAAIQSIYPRGSNGRLAFIESAVRF